MSGDRAGVDASDSEPPRCDNCGSRAADDRTVFLELDRSNLDRTIASRTEASASGGGESITSLVEGASAYHLCPTCRASLGTRDAPAPDRADDASVAIDEHWGLSQLLVAGFTILVWYFLLSVPFRFQVDPAFGFQFGALVIGLWIVSIVLRRTLDMRRLSALALLR